MLTDSPEVFVIIPVYNEETVICQVIEKVKKIGNYRILVVDDGSQDKTYAVCKADPDILTLRQRINRGKGCAVKTGLMAANRFCADVIVTMDGDGQHDPYDIPALVDPILREGYDVVLGTRRLSSGEMPLIRRIANHIGNFCTWLFCGIWVSDSQSGFRAFSRYAAAIIDTKADGYEYDSKVIQEINRNNLKYKEVPVTVHYTDYSLGKIQQQGFVNGIKTLLRMIWGIIS